VECRRRRSEEELRSWVRGRRRIEVLGVVVGGVEE